MGRGYYLFLGFLLAACVAPLPSASTAIFISSPIPILPTYTPSSSLLSPNSSTPDTLIPMATSSSTPVETANGTPTKTAVEPAMDTPVSFVHFFPLQPPSAAGFAEGTSSHGYPATDIFALAGTNFVAVTDGVVDFVSYQDLWDPNHDDPALRGGLSVAIVGDDGVRYYGSHLSAIASGIAPGVRVKAGQLLGQVGNTGDARNTMSHLHFGISPHTYPDDWKSRRGLVDPFPFLQAWKDGHNITPPVGELFTATPSETSTNLPSNAPTRTTNLFTHVFPIQPPELAGFSEGGHAFPATDIFAPLGTKFVAVTNRTVDLVTSVDGWDPDNPDRTKAGGLSVRIIGDDGLRYYGAHLSSIARGIIPGAWIPAGQLLGLVGNTGDARITATHLHFEISSPVSPFTMIDPFPLLLAWRDGQNVTPTLPVP